MAQHLVTYLCVSAIVIALLLPLYFIACRNAERIVDQEQIQRISKGFWEVREALAQCQSHAYDLASNPDLVRLSLSGNDDPNLALYLYNLTLFQRKNLWNNPLAMETIVQFARNDTVMTRYSVYRDKRLFYGPFFRYEGVSFGDWQDSLFRRKEEARDDAGAWTYEGGATRAVTLNFYYPSLSAPMTVVSFLVPVERLLSGLMTEEMRRYGNFRLSYGGREKPLVVSFDSGRPSGGRLVFLEEFQPRLSLDAGLSRDTYVHAAYPLHYALLVYIVLACLAALALSFVFARVNVRPLETMVGFISQLGIPAGEYEGNAYAYIRQALAGVTHSEEQLKKAYDLAQSSFERTVFRMSIQGLRVEPDHLRRALGQVPALHGRYVLVGVSREPRGRTWPVGTDPDLAMLEVRRLFMERTVKPYFHESETLYAALHVDPRADPQATDSLLQDMHRSLLEILRADLCFGVSRECDGLEQLQDAADQVANALQGARTGLAGPVVRYDPSSADNLPPVPVNEDALARLLVQEEEEPLKAYMESLQDAVCGGSPQTPLQAKTVYYSVLAVFQKVLRRLCREDGILLRDFDAEAGLRANMRHLMEAGLEIREAACARRHTHKTELVRRVLDYIRENYSSRNLCLTMVADHFALSERYLSSLIREQTGKNYSDHVEQIRMDEARRLLSDTATSVNDVAARVGYDRANSFYKSFKRHTGLSPRQFRLETHQGLA